MVSSLLSNEYNINITFDKTEIFKTIKLHFCIWSKEINEEPSVLDHGTLFLVCFPFIFSIATPHKYYRL